MLERGEGALLYDAEGREYLDALSGGVFAVLAGYGREEIARAMYEQAQRLNYTSPYATTSVVTIELARKLAELAPGDLSASFFCNSGSAGGEGGRRAAPPPAPAPLRHRDRRADPGQRSGTGVLRDPRAGHGDRRLHRPPTGLPG